MHKSILFSELLWFFIVAVLIALLALPIYYNGVEFKFWALFIGSYAILIYFLRTILLLHLTLFGRNIWIQAGIIFLCLPLFFVLYNALHGFQTHLDYGELNVLLDEYTLETRRFLFEYIKKVTILGAVGALLTILIMPIRLLISIWKLFKVREKKAKTR